MIMNYEMASSMYSGTYHDIGTPRFPLQPAPQKSPNLCFQSMSSAIDQSTVSKNLHYLIPLRYSNSDGGDESRNGPARCSVIVAEMHNSQKKTPSPLLLFLQT